MTEFLKALKHAQKLQLQFISLPIAEAENVATEIESLKTTNIGGVDYRDRLLRQQRAELEAIVSLGYELSAWTACINWRGGENQKEWLDELRIKIERFQSLAEPVLNAAAVEVA